MVILFTAEEEEIPVRTLTCGLAPSNAQAFGWNCSSFKMKRDSLWIHISDHVLSMTSKGEKGPTGLESMDDGMLERNPVLSVQYLLNVPKHPEPEQCYERGFHHLRNHTD